MRALRRRAAHRLDERVRGVEAAVDHARLRAPRSSAAADVFAGEVDDDVGGGDLVATTRPAPADSRPRRGRRTLGGLRREDDDVVAACSRRRTSGSPMNPVPPAITILHGATF